MQNEFSEITKFKHSLTKNRSEHIGKDVWKDFVIPRFFNRVDLASAMPARLEGGRGSGKTMLLRYLSYHSQFSPNRENIPENVTGRIGLYWKADTQFLRLMQKRGIEEDVWAPTFDHYLNLKLSQEVLLSVRCIADSSYQGIQKAQLEDTVFEGISDFGFSDESFSSVYKEISSRIRKAEVAIQNVKGINDLNKLPVSFLNFIIDSVKESFECLSATMYSVYIDEYENLLGYQQRIVNTRIKHSEMPLIYNIAIKLNGMSETLTLSDEKLENIADYTIINLDEEIDRSGFDTYVSEIFLKKLNDASPSIVKNLDINLSVCSDANRIDERYEVEYESECKGALNKIFPGRTHQDLADEVFETPVYYKKMVSEIERALKIKGCNKLDSSNFISDENRKASVVCASILFRRSADPYAVLLELEKLKAGEANKFTSRTAWEHNYFIGCYLRIVRAFKGNSTFYSGFDVYSALSGGNVRHFLELCKTAISLRDDYELQESFVVDRKLQHMAARSTSAELVKEIQRFTPLGNQLDKFVRSIGKIFQLCQDRESQSETEVTHFGIRDEESVFDDEDQRILNEAEKWGVLKAIPSTKNKSLKSSHTYDYVLNPVYSPFFLISYRKGRKIDIDATDFKNMYLHGETSVGGGIRKKLRLIDIDETHVQPKQSSLL